VRTKTTYNLELPNHFHRFICVRNRWLVTKIHCWWMEKLVFKFFWSICSDSVEINSWVWLLVMAEYFGWLEVKFLVYRGRILDYFKSPSLERPILQFFLYFWGRSVQFCQRGCADLATCRAFSLCRTSFSLITRLNCNLRTAVQQALARSISADGGLPNGF
jgi:hypothetical protein